MKYYFLALGALVVVCMGCAGIDGHSVLKSDEYVAPPAAMMQRPGPMVDGPGPGVMGMLAQPVGMGGDYGMGAAGNQATQIKFIGQDGMSIGWMAGNVIAHNQKYVPGRADFPQGAVYQLEFANIPGDGWAGVSLYPTLEVRTAHPNTMSYLAHSTVPIEITEQDLQHVRSNNIVTKVIYLPDPKNQSRAIIGVETLVSTPLDPGLDPVAEAERRGTIMAILRMGNKELNLNEAQVDAGGNVLPVSYVVLDGEQSQYVAPTPVAMIPTDVQGVPGAMIAAGGGMPGQPIMPIAGMGPTPPWGMPMTSTPIGLVGPPSLPFGGPAGLQQHVVRNRTQNNMPEPVDTLLIDVKQNPGYSVPEPVRHIQYTESHPVHAPGEVATPQSRGAFMGY